MNAYLFKNLFENLPVIILSGTVIMLSGALLYVLSGIRREYAMLERMLDSAIEGNFEENKFDEMRISRLENKMYQFLSSSFLGRKSIEEEKAKVEELIANISHQTKTPITTIRLYAGLLEEKDLPEEEKKLASRISQQNDRMAFLIENLVKMSRLENGIVSVHPVKQDISLLMESLAGSFEQGGDKRISFDPGFRNREPVRVCYDLKWTVEAVSNIIENAQKYTDQNGMIHISVIPYHSFTAIQIKDNGMGIAEEEQASIFRRFYRSEKVNDEKGVGLGLYLAREIITKQGGYISLQSEVGKGSCFRVFLPDRSGKKQSDL